MILSDKQHQQIHFYLLVLFCFFYILLPRFAVVAVLLLVINAATGGYLQRNRQKAFSLWPMLSIAFFLLHLFGMFYTSNLGEGFSDLESKLSFLLLPPVLFAVPLKIPQARTHILHAFIAGCTIATLYAYTRAAILYFQTGLNAFYYEYLSGFLLGHPSYLAIYLIFSIFILLEEFFRKQNQLSLVGKAGRILLVLHFLGFIFLLTARMQLLLCIFLLSIALIGYMAAQKKLIIGIFSLVFFIGLTGALMWQVPTTQTRLINAYQQFFDPSVAPNIRVPIWKVGQELVMESPLFGHGTGDVQDNLVRLYQRDQITRALQSNYNTHNQFLQTSIALGFLGLAILLALLFWPLAIALRRGAYVYAFFMSLLILSMLTECIFETQKGILFFTFFYGFFASQLSEADALK